MGATPPISWAVAALGDLTGTAANYPPHCVGPDFDGVGPDSPAVWRELLRATRPRQWSKSLLVFAAPLLSGRFTERDVLGNAAVAFVAFTLAASAVYLINDACDVESDRAHPTKRRRPVAAGTLSARTASWVGGLLAAAALVVALISGLDLVIVIAVYLALSMLYCFALKDEPVIDIAIIAAGFLLRAIAGGAAAGIELSQWFLLARVVRSLFMAAGKRYAEILLVDEGGPGPFRALVRVQRVPTCASSGRCPQGC